MIDQDEKREFHNAPLHKSVLSREVLEALKVDELAHSKKDFKIIDATLGLGGHSAEIVKRGGIVLGIEADQKELEIAREVLEKACPTPVTNRSLSSETPEGNTQILLINGNFKNISLYAGRYDFFDKVNGVLFDLGISSYQLERSERGFSFADLDQPLDMRLSSVDQDVTAADLLNALDERQLEDLFTTVIDKKYARNLAQKIVDKRKYKKFLKVSDFVDITGQKNFGKDRLNPATLPFLALRIAVNSEIENISKALPQAFDLLEHGGRLVVISFHSGEDRVVKNYFKKVGDEGLARIITRKPIEASVDEVADNPKSRSAKLRVIEKI